VRIAAAWSRFHPPRTAILAFEWIIVLGVFGFFFVYFNVSSAPGRSYPLQDKCASNLQQIGREIRNYCNENDGQFPDSFSTLLLNDAGITSNQFVCPESGDVPEPSF
jgi:hypothetical protein